MDMAEDQLPRPVGGSLGQVNDYFEGGQKYLQYLKQTVDEDFSGIHIALDCAHGATSPLATHLFADLDADLSMMGASLTDSILMQESDQLILKRYLHLLRKKKQMLDWHLMETETA